MKLVTIALIIMSFTMVSCGGDDKDKSSSSGRFTNNLSTQTGYYNLSSQNLEIDGQTYSIQQYYQAIQPALLEAQQRNIQPRQVNGAYKLRAKVTARLMNYNQPYNQQYNQPYNSNTYNQYQGGYNQQNYNQGMLEIQNIDFY